MPHSVKTTQKIIESSNKIEELLLLKLLEEEPNFTGKITIDVNCNQGGITSVEVFTLRKVDKKII